MPNHGKKIPTDVIKDAATRAAFDRVEQRLKLLEQNINKSPSFKSVFIDSKTITTGTWQVSELINNTVCTGGLIYGRFKEKDPGSAGGNLSAVFQVRDVVSLLVRRNGIYIHEVPFPTTNTPTTEDQYPYSWLNFLDDPPNGDVSYGVEAYLPNVNSRIIITSLEFGVAEFFSAK